MALILFAYKDFFYRRRGNDADFANGRTSYFDPVERVFLRIDPSEGDRPAAHWIPLPVIKEADVFRNYLRLMGRVSILKEYEDLDDFHFAIQISKIADHYQFHLELNSYEICYCSEVIGKWAEDNHIPNCKTILEPPLMEIETVDDMRRKIKIMAERLKAEELQEEEFKRSLR